MSYCGYKLYIVLFLHQTATSATFLICSRVLYIVLFLHQTATSLYRSEDRRSCISFYSYIKPQRSLFQKCYSCVVYRSIPTSNRNLYLRSSRNSKVVYRSIPTSNRNMRNRQERLRRLYIVLFLHQTATLRVATAKLSCCISFYSYIKPQRRRPFHCTLSCCISFYSYIKPQLLFDFVHQILSCISFYSYIKPQRSRRLALARSVVYRSIPTSNRNSLAQFRDFVYVVYRSIPTSNRNCSYFQRY